ncbi:GntR family transcriptional regulator [Microbaculum marinisediminis]|uniref:GntR family transcriptional regulator n=1 Tax=Microbaculum marinisediminis TaxID=2931392 RepID=A0AAW5R7J1_9HYPH|nr:GntR family transcriptional regulator [Microbaculum sp. A6E488]MCT8974638.1 GntR family transcriptional regulator [Microbaculum sp. A6E488]
MTNDVEAKEPTKADATQERMRTDLITGQLKPGLQLKIHELQERYSVSQTTIREVLPKLVHEGLVTSSARKGYAVCRLSLEDLEDLAALRLDLELPAFETSMKQGDVDWEVGVLRAQHLMRKFVAEAGASKRAEHAHGWLEIHAGFHSALIAGCGSERRMQYCRQIFTQSSRYFVVAAKYMQSSDVNLSEHLELGDIALDRDIETGKERLRQHVLQALTNMKRFFEETENGVPG